MILNRKANQNHRKVLCIILGMLIFLSGMGAPMVAEAAANNWVNVGYSGFSAKSADHTSIALDSNGTPYVVYEESGKKATVMKYDGFKWRNVGSAGFSAGNVSYTRIAIDSNDTPYVVYRDQDKNFKATVMNFNGLEWETVGSAGFSAGNADYTSIAFDQSGTPYVVYRDGGNSSKATVMKYNGSSWEIVGSAGFSAGSATYTDIAIDSGGTPYVAYQDGSINGKPTVMKYNGSSWETVGSAGFSASNVSYTRIAIDSNDTPYVVYQDQDKNSKATVMKYNINSWETVGSAGFSAGNAEYTSIAVDRSGTPYVAYQDATNGLKATVMKYNGSSWERVGSVGFSAGRANYTNIALDSGGTPYITYQDGGNSNRATVMKFTMAYTVTYDKNGATSGSAPTDSTAYQPGDSAKVQDNTGGLVKTGYTFSGWNTEPDGTGTDYAAGTRISIGSADVTLYAKWTAVPVTGVTLDKSTLTLTAGAGTAKLTATVSPSNAVQNVTWSSSDMSVATVDSSGAVTPVGAGIAYIKVTTTVGSYTATSTVAVSSANLAFCAFEHDTCSVSGTGTVHVRYGVNGKYTYGDFSSTFTCDNGTFGDPAPGSVKACFILQQTVSFNSNGGASVSSQTVNYNHTAIKPADPSKLGYTFGGWYSDSGLNSAFDFNTPIKTDMMLYAKWVTARVNQWVDVGSTGFSAGRADYTGIAIDSRGTPYVVYQDGGNAYQATVMKYNGSSWENVGPPGFSTYSVAYPSIAVDSKGAPYVVYQDGGRSRKATVMKYNGNSWENVGSPGFSIGTVYETNIAIDSSDTPYVVYQDESRGNKASVMKFNRVSNTWEYTGSPGFSSGNVTSTHIAIDKSGTPYVVYKDWVKMGMATVMKYNGISWENVGPAGFTSGNPDFTDIAVDSSGTPYVSYPDGKYGSRATVMKYNGKSWENVGSAGFTEDSADRPSIIFDSGGAPYVVYSDFGKKRKATVKKFNGSAWENVGAAGFTAGDAFYTRMVIDDSNGNLYVVFQDGNNSSKSSVMAFILTFAVTYDGNGATSGSVPTDSNAYHKGDAATILGNTGVLVKTGYTFAGWNTKADGTGTDYTAGAPIRLGLADVKLYAKWALVNAATPVIVTQPVGATVNEGASSPVLSIAATVSDSGTLNYQWYSSTTSSNSGGTAITGAMGASYAAPTSKAGTTYYYVVVTNTNNSATGSKTATVTSNVATVTVNATTPVPVDTLPPVTAAVASSVYGPDPVYNFYRSDITLTLTATDSGPSALATEYASGVKRTEYRVNGGTWNVYTGPILVQQNGVYTYEYRSTDNAGNVENVKSIELKLDKTAPVTLYHFDPIFARNKAGQQYISGFTTTLRATDPEAGSGVKTTLYRINGGAWTLYSGSFTVTAGSTKTVEYYSVDHAGNIEGPMNKMDFVKGIFTGAGLF